MGSNGEKSTAPGNTGAQSRLRGVDKAGHDDDADTRDFIESHNVTKIARKDVPGSGEESADLAQDEGTDRPKSAT